MVDFVPLEQLVPDNKLKLVDEAEKYNEVYTKVKVRRQTCQYLTKSRRTLWQAVGIEYIEPEMLDYIDSHKAGSIFYDVGASNGLFSIYAAQCGLSVFSFEPEVQNFSLLSGNAYLNKNVLNPIKCFNIALGDSTSLNNMFISKYEAGGHMKILGQPLKVGDTQLFSPDFVQNVIAYSLDDFIRLFNLPIPNHIKIDVDGSETQVLNGAEMVLSSKALETVFIELETNNNNTLSIIQKLTDSGFKIQTKTQVQNYQGLFNYVFRR
ncbi:FkbM family methyltransferase [Aliiglaciecola lipolytica]|uniref:FkbM family methyltransferase n=1 Tax=Aliiglaciecola lipolytica TaxID=477689 RepID=UPI001C085B41|nr:FkbM family methyltransferase [Aliiglaciecola lipolytica]MBU2878009.1 FkbM family methyltransferase [Aliiglaciecola lipolytica]